MSKPDIKSRALEEAEPVEINFEYCSSCGFRARAVEYKEALEKAFGDRVEVDMEAGRPTSFEVTADNQLVHSKLETKKWPDVNELIEKIKKIVGSANEEAINAMKEELKEREEALKGLTIEQASEFIDETLNKYDVVIFSKTYCPFCKKAKAALEYVEQEYFAVELDKRADGPLIQDALHQKTGQKTVPNVFLRGKSLGGGDKVAELAQSGKLRKMIDQPTIDRRQAEIAEKSMQLSGLPLVESGKGPLAPTPSAGVRTLKKVNNDNVKGDVVIEMGDLDESKDINIHSKQKDDKVEKEFEKKGGVWPTYGVPLWLRFPLFYFPYNVNLTAVRLNATLVFFMSIITGIGCALGEQWGRYLVACQFADFVLRFIYGGRGSLLGAIAGWASQFLKPQVTPGAPKQFAQFVGSTMTGIATLVMWINIGEEANEYSAAVLMWILALFSGLEAFLNFCAGCFIFKYLVHWKLIIVDPSIRSDSIASEVHHTLLWFQERTNQTPADMIYVNLPKDENDRKAPFKYRPKNDDYRRDDFHLIKHCGINLYGWQMGTVGIAAAWKYAYETASMDVPNVWEGLAILSAIFMCFVSGLYILKIILYPKRFWKEWDHFMLSSFLPAPFLCISVFAYLCADKPFNDEDSSLNTFAHVLYWIGSGGSVLFSTLIIAKWIRRPHYKGLIMPPWMLGPVGLLVNGLVGVYVSSNYYEWAYFNFSAGLLFWIVLFTMTLQRAMFGPIMDKIRGTIFIWIAAPSAGALSYFALEQRFDFIARLLTYVGLFVTLIMLWLTIQGYFGRTRFNMGYWAFGFPTQALAMNLILYNDQIRTDISDLLAKSSLALASGVFLILKGHTIALILKRHHIFTPEEKAGALCGFFKVTHYAMRDTLDVLVKLSRKVHRPRELKRFAELYYQFQLTHQTHSKYEDDILFPYIEQFFPGHCSHAHEDHELEQREMEQIRSLIGRYSPETCREVMGSLCQQKAENVVAKRGTITKDEQRLLQKLTKSLRDRSNKHFDWEENNIAPVMLKYFNMKLGKEIAKKVWHSVSVEKWRIIIPFVIQNQALHMRRVKFLKMFQISLRERLPLIGRFLYEKLDEVTWDRLRVDIPEMIPRYVEGFSRMY